MLLFNATGMVGVAHPNTQPFIWSFRIDELPPIPIIQRYFFVCLELKYSAIRQGLVFICNLSSNQATAICGLRRPDLWWSYVDLYKLKLWLQYEE